MLMYVSTADVYKYCSLMRVYTRTSKIQSISFILSLLKSHYFIFHLQSLQCDLRQVMSPEWLATALRDLRTNSSQTIPTSVVHEPARLVTHLGSRARA